MVATPHSAAPSARPAHLDLWAALSWRQQDFAHHSGLQCVCAVDIPPDLPAPQGPVATAVFLIFQEMLSNVLRHARASAVQIRIRATPIELTVLVHDNGHGAPPSVFDRHDAGVARMRERAAEFGGWLQIDSLPGQGTQIILSMPLRHVRAMPVTSPGYKLS